MGNSNNTIDVTFDRTQPTIYYTGDFVSGHVHFIIPQGTNDIDGIYLTITGDVGYTTERRVRVLNGMTDRVTENHDIRIFGEKILLSQAIASQQGQSFHRTNSTRTVTAGEYTLPFAIRLPNILPPTIHPKDYPFVRYGLELFIEKKWYSANTSLCHPLRVYPRVNLLNITNSNCAVKFDTRCNDITVIGILQHSGVLPGEKTDISLEIYNPTRLTIKRLDICLMQHYEIEVCRRRLELLRLTIPQFNNNDGGHIQTVCPITIPIGIAPSYDYRSRPGRSGVSVHVHYNMKIDVKIKGLFTDFDLQVPLVIGTDSGSHSNGTAGTMRTATVVDLNAIDLLEQQVVNE